MQRASLVRFCSKLWGTLLPSGSPYVVCRLDDVFLRSDMTATFHVIKGAAELQLTLNDPVQVLRWNGRTTDLLHIIALDQQ